MEQIIDILIIAEKSKAAFPWGAVIGGAITVGNSIFGTSAANRRANDANKRKDRLSKELEELELTRQIIPNPYAGVKDLSEMVSDLSGMITNPFANLGVATKAAEIKIEQSDIALANTLDTLRSTGASAGGATALAQAALASKKGVAASIEAQEANNEKLRAQGRADLERVQMAEAGRIQGVQMAEALRMQQTDVAAIDFEFSTREKRQTEQLNRKQAQITGEAQAAANERANAASIMGAGIAGVAGIASGAAKAMYTPNRLGKIPSASNIYAGERYNTNYEAQTRSRAADVFGGGATVPLSPGTQDLYTKLYGE